MVIDASALIQFLAFPDGRPELKTVILAAEQWYAPDVIYLEVLSSLRTLCRKKELEEEDANEIRGALLDFPLQVFSSVSFHERIWELRHVYSVYDSSYIALAEALGSPLITLDANLSRGHATSIEFKVY